MLWQIPAIAFADGIVNPLGAGATICSLIQKVLQALMIIGVPVVVLLIVFVGFQFIMAQGNTTAVGKARDNLFNTLIGAVLFFGATLMASVITNTLTALGVSGLSGCQ